MALLNATACAAGPFFRGLAIDIHATVCAAASGCSTPVKIAPGRKVAPLLQLKAPWSPTAAAFSGDDLYVLEYLHTASENRLEWLPRVSRISPNGKTAVLATVDRR